MSKLKDALNKHLITSGKCPHKPSDINPCNYCGANAGQGLSKQPTYEIKKKLTILQPKCSVMYQEIFSESAAPVPTPGVRTVEILP